MHLKFCTTLTTAVLITVLAGEGNLDELHSLEYSEVAAACVGSWNTMLRRKPPQDARAPSDHRRTQLFGLENFSAHNCRANLPVLSEMGIHLPLDHIIFSFQRGAVIYNFTFKVAVLLFKYRITSTLLISCKSWGDHKPHVHFSLSLTLQGLWHWAQIYHADTVTSCWRPLLKCLAKHKPRYFLMWSLCWHYQHEHVLYPAVEAGREEIPWPVTTGVRPTYFTDGKSNSYLLMTEPTFNLSPTRTIKATMPVSTTCPVETRITQRADLIPHYMQHTV